MAVKRECVWCHVGEETAPLSAFRALWFQFLLCEECTELLHQGFLFLRKKLGPVGPSPEPMPGPKATYVPPEEDSNG